MTCARTAVAIACVAALAACAGNKVLPPRGRTAYGVYRFREVLASAHPPIMLAGAVFLLPDTLTLSLDNGPCVLASASRGNTQTMTYACGEYSFSFDRRNPLRDNSYRVPTISYTTNRICMMTSVDRNGRETCTRYGNERIEQNSMISGKLRFVGQ